MFFLITNYSCQFDFKSSTKRAERSNAIDLYVSGFVGEDVTLENWSSVFNTVPQLMTAAEKKDWCNKLTGRFILDLTQCNSLEPVSGSMV